jgi:toxin ParE1/3/4
VKLRWSHTAGHHLDSIYDFISADNPEAAARTVEKIIEACEQLERHPHLGRPGRYPGTRELVHTLFVIVYRVKEDVISIEAVLHGNQKYE